MKKNNLSFLSRKLSSFEDSFTSSEYKIAKLLLKDPEEFIHLSVTEIAEQSSTSVATVSRFTKKLGYKGLSELKISISSDIQSHLYDENLHLDVNESDSVSEMVKKVFEGNIEAIQDTKKVLNVNDLAKVINFIFECKRLIFFGIGGSSSIATDAHHKFIRTGKMVEVVTDPHKQMILSSVSTKDDLIIGISHEGKNVDLNETLKIAKENKSKIVAITQYSNSPITAIADVTLFTLSRETNYRPESLTSRIAAHTITDAIYVGYAMRVNKKMASNLVKIRKNMRRLKK